MLKNDSIMVDKTPTLESTKVTSVDVSDGEDKGKVKVDELIVNQIPQLPPPFP